MTVVPPALRHVLTVHVEVAAPVVVGTRDGWTTRSIAITGGTVSGPGVSGRVLPGGADVQQVGATVAHLDARYLLELDDESRILVENRAVRAASEQVSAAIARGEAVDPDEVYFRCVPRLSADASGPWGWIDDRVFIGAGRRLPTLVEIDVFEVL